MKSKFAKKDFNLKRNTLTKVFLNFLGNLFFVYCLIISLALILFSAVTIECEVDGASMQPTLNKLDENKHDYVFVNIYDNDYSYGDIIIVEVPGESIIKRIVGLPGDVIDIVYVNNDYKLERNGEIVDEEYILIDDEPTTPTNKKNGNYKTKSKLDSLEEKSPELFTDGKYVVGENEVFALGDNRHVSLDSSYYGAFDFENITGKVELIKYYGSNSFYLYYRYIVDGMFIKTLINIF